jgi:hypothetical protein
MLIGKPIAGKSLKFSAKFMPNQNKEISKKITS